MSTETGELQLPPDLSLVYRLRDVRGYDPPKPDIEFYELFRLINPQHPPGEGLIIPELTPRGRTVLDMLGARYLIAAPGTPKPAGRGLALVYRGADADVYRNAEAVPRAFVPATVTLARSEREALVRIASADFDPRKEAVVESSTPAAGTGSVRVVRDEPSTVVIRAAVPRPGLLVLTDALDAGWRVEVDRRQARALRVDRVLRGVEIPAGRHTVRWSYRTPGLVTGACLSALGLALLVAWAAAIVFRLRTRRR